MARRSAFQTEDDSAEINLSPMIDCIFILLIFFIVTTVFVEEPGVEVRRPPAALDEELERQSILIAISAENEVVYGGKEVGVSGAGARVKQLLNKEELPVIIQADAAADHGVSVSTAVEVGEPWRTIVDYAERYDQDLVVMPTHGREGLSRYLGGSVSEKVVRLSSVPVLSVRMQPDEVLTFPYENVLVPTDGSDAPERAMAQALALAETFDADLHLLHVIDTRRYDTSIESAHRRSISTSSHETFSGGSGATVPSTASSTARKVARAPGAATARIPRRAVSSAVSVSVASPPLPPVSSVAAVSSAHAASTWSASAIPAIGHDASMLGRITVWSSSVMMSADSAMNVTPPKMTYSASASAASLLSW